MAAAAALRADVSTDDHHMLPATPIATPQDAAAAAATLAATPAALDSFDLTWLVLADVPARVGKDGMLRRALVEIRRLRALLTGESERRGAGAPVLQYPPPHEQAGGEQPLGPQELQQPGQAQQLQEAQLPQPQPAQPTQQQHAQQLQHPAQLPAHPQEQQLEASQSATQHAAREHAAEAESEIDAAQRLITGGALGISGAIPEVDEEDEPANDCTAEAEAEGLRGRVSSAVGWRECAGPDCNEAAPAGAAASPIAPALAAVPPTPLAAATRALPLGDDGGGATAAAVLPDVRKPSDATPHSATGPAANGAAQDDARALRAQLREALQEIASLRASMPAQGERPEGSTDGQPAGRSDRPGSPATALPDATADSSDSEADLPALPDPASAALRDGRAWDEHLDSAGSICQRLLRIVAAWMPVRRQLAAGEHAAHLMRRDARLYRKLHRVAGQMADTVCTRNVRAACNGLHIACAPGW